MGCRDQLVLPSEMVDLQGVMLVIFSCIQLGISLSVSSPFAHFACPSELCYIGCLHVFVRFVVCGCANRVYPFWLLMFAFASFICVFCV